MISIGQMVRVNGSAAMKVIDVTDDLAECVWIDGNGQIRRRFHSVTDLSPFWLSLGPRSAWPDLSHLDLIEIEKEEQAARDARKATKKAAQKAKRSNKIKRKAAA